MTKNTLEWAGTILTIISFGLIAEQIILGFYIGIVANVIWVLWVKGFGGVPFYILQGFLFLINLKGIIL